jgi:hypothetical protein
MVMSLGGSVSSAKAGVAAKRQAADSVAATRPRLDVSISIFLKRLRFASSHLRAAVAPRFLETIMLRLIALHNFAAPHKDKSEGLYVSGARCGFDVTQGCNQLGR